MSVALPSHARRDAGRFILRFHCISFASFVGSVGFRVYMGCMHSTPRAVFLDGWRTSCDGRGAREAERGDARACGDRSWGIPRRDERASEGERDGRANEPVGDVHAVTSRDRSIRGGGARARARGGREREGREGRTGRKRRRAPWRW